MFVIVLAATGLMPPPLARHKPLSRRAVLGGAAAGLAAAGTPPAFAAAKKELLTDRVARLEKETAERNSCTVEACTKKDITPQLTVYGTQTKVTTAGLAAQAEMVVPHVMDADGPHFIEYMWLKDAKTGKVYAAKKLRPTDTAPPILIASLPVGVDVVPMCFCSRDGLWQGDTVRVSTETNAFTPGYSEGRSLVQ